MRIAILSLATLVGIGAAEAAQIEVLTASPNRIEVATSCWAGSSYCAQEASDVAQGYCHGKFEDNARRAVPVRWGPVEGSDRVIFVFRCDRRPIVCQAGSC